jgi:hypothetical protein
MFSMADVINRNLLGNYGSDWVFLLIPLSSERVSGQDVPGHDLHCHINPKSIRPLSRLYGQMVHQLC